MGHACLQRLPQTNGSDVVSNNQQASDLEPPHICMTFSSSGLNVAWVLFLTVHVILSSSISSDVQRGVILKVSSVRLKRDHETFKLKSSKAPPCPPLPNLQVALLLLLLPPDTETVPLLLKRPVKLQARQAPPLRLKLTRGTLTTLIVAMVSSVRSEPVRTGPSTCITAWRMCLRPKMTPQGRQIV